MIDVLGCPLDRAGQLLAQAGVQAEIILISRGREPNAGTLRVVKQEGARLTAAPFLCGAPARKETE